MTLPLARVKSPAVYFSAPTRHRMATMKNRNHGLRKYCDHPRREWARCGCPWHANYRGARASLNKRYGKPPGYSMSKTEAVELYDRFRAEFGTEAERKRLQADSPVRLTFGEVADLYDTGHVRAAGRRPRPISEAAYKLRIIRATMVRASDGRMIPLEEKPIAEVAKADVETVRDERRRTLAERAARKGRGEGVWRQGLPGARGGEVGVEHIMGTLRHLFRWAIREGHVDATPFLRHGEPVILVRTQKKQHRRRRLDAESKEEERLLAAALPKGRVPGMASHLHDLIVAALETGCRLGELLSLQWWQVKGDSRYLDLPADKTKTNEPRLVPITARLKAILDGRRAGPDGEELGREAHVFGDEAGGAVGTIATAWRAARRRAGIEDLHFHDLRHEFISRLLEAGVPIHQVRDWAGHKSIATTGIYANTTLTHLEGARKAFEAHAANGSSAGSA